ncbi:uncharacterized protein G2W53_017828 [Senna tora]|uniref:Uncharacterized protein n=1 Tax=Senna tora TaxID=362788 RepID=A0A834TZE1_9FABA|nr:uncharacterized protein G2W53_017828 [Senna tora]
MTILPKVPVTCAKGVNDGIIKVPVTCMEGVIDDTKVPVTCVEGVDDATKVLETCMEEFNDVTNNGSRDKCERVDDVTHPSWCSACEDSKDEVECKKLTMVLIKVLPASMEGVGATKDSREQSIPCACEQRQQARARGCVEGFDDGATEDSDNHVKLLPCSDIPPCDDKEMLKVTLSVNFSLKTKQDGILCALKDALTEHVEGSCLLKSTSTLNLAVLVSCTLLAGGSSSLCLLDQLMSASGMAALHSNAKPFACSRPSSHGSLVLEWRPLAISLLMWAMKFSVFGGGILFQQQVGASRNIPFKALLGSSRSIEGSWFFFGFFVSVATSH